MRFTVPTDYSSSSSTSSSSDTSPSEQSDLDNDEEIEQLKQISKNQILSFQSLSRTTTTNNNNNNSNNNGRITKTRFEESNSLRKDKKTNGRVSIKVDRTSPVSSSIKKNKNGSLSKSEKIGSNRSNDDGRIISPSKKSSRFSYSLLRRSNSIKTKNDQSQESNLKFCQVSTVPRSETSPSPFANPPSSVKSTSIGFKDSLRSSLRIRIEDQSDSSGDDYDQDGEDEILDSEEEQWPISKSSKLPSSSSSSKAPRTSPQKKKTTQYFPSGPKFLLVDHDPVQIWDQRERQSTYQLSIQNAIQRRKVFEGIHFRTIKLANENFEKESKKKIDELNEILARIGLDNERETRQMKEGFERREKERSRIFESMILEAEKLEEEELLRINRLKQEEAARKAEQERKELLIRQELEERKKRLDQLKLKEKLEKEEEEKRLKEAEIEAQTRAKVSDELEIVRSNYEKWYSTMQRIKNHVLPTVSSNEKFKSMCRQAKRRITPKVGQLTNSYKQIQKVIMELGDVLRDAKQMDRDVYLWACNHLSKALIKQAETEVTAKLNTVYPLARVVIGLILIGYQELGDVLMARLVKKCYFVTGYRPLPREDQSEDDYRKVLGYQPVSQEESSIQYSNRMSGIFALYIAICQTDPQDVVPVLKGPAEMEKLQRIPAQLRLDCNWTLISFMLREPIIGLNATPSLISTLIDVGGERMDEVYGSQWVKLLRVILSEGIRSKRAKFDWEKCVPSIVRLEACLEEIEKNGWKPKVIDGRLYDNDF